MDWNPEGLSKRELFKAAIFRAARAIDRFIRQERTHKFLTPPPTKEEQRKQQEEGTQSIHDRNVTWTF